MKRELAVLIGLIFCVSFAIPGVFAVVQDNKAINNYETIGSYEGIGDGRDLERSSALDKKNSPIFSGYIVEFKEKPLAVRQAELKNQKTRADTTQELKNQKTKLQKEHENALADFGKYLNEEPRRSPPEEENLNLIDRVILFFKNIFIKEKQISYSPKENEVEYYNVFNGIYLDITKEQADNIKKSPYVKSVSPNYKVEPMLMDSVPLIQEGTPAGQLDINGGNCISSGKECLTGKNVTIAIIDSGVDYTHPDLGCVNDTRCGNVVWNVFDSILPSIYGDKIVWQDWRNRNSDIYMYDLSTNQERLITDNPANQYDSSIYEDKIVWTDRGNRNSDIYMYDLSTNQERLITDNPANQYDSSIYEDKIVWTDRRNENSDIYMYDLLTNTTRQITNNTFDQYSPAIYGDKIVWEDYRNQSYDIYMYDLSTNQERQITNNTFDQYSPAIYGDKIVWTDGRNANWDIYMYDLLTNTTRQITNNTFSQRYPAIYGDKIVWEDNRNENSDIYMYDLSTNQERQITNNTFSQRYPAIYGDKIVWEDRRNENSDIYMYDLSTNQERQITYNFITNLSGLFPNLKVIGGYDFSGDNFKENPEEIIPDDNPVDYGGHGTHVAATAAGNGILKGVAPDAKILAYKVFPNSDESVIISAIERAVDPNQDGDFSDHADIISMSLGLDCKIYFGGYISECGPDDAMSRTVDNAVDSGVAVVIAAGNSGPDEQTIGSPGTARKAITVGAIDKLNNIADFSSRGPVVWQDAEGNNQTMIKPDIVAPGVGICSAEWDSAWSSYRCLDDKHVAISGTSMATPHVAGAVALIKQAHPDWSPEKIKNALKSTAINLGYDNNTQGAGKIDIVNIVKITNGICNQTLNTCIQGNFLDIPDNSTHYLWKCNGLYGGSNASCNLIKPCEDSDGGQNYTRKGATTMVPIWGNWTDLCARDNSLQEPQTMHYLLEGYCAGTNLGAINKSVNCRSQNKYCENGTCVTIPTVGFILVKSTPSGAKLSYKNNTSTTWITNINGQIPTTPWLFKNFKQGIYYVNISKQGYMDIIETVNVTAGNTSVINKTLLINKPLGTIFVTNTSYNGNLSGIAGADAKCMARAQAGNLNGTWIALLSNSTLNMTDRIPNMTYKRMDGKIIANNKLDLFDGSIQNAIGQNEFGLGRGVFPLDLVVHTGSTIQGTKVVNANCNNWISSNSSVSSYQGKSSQTNYEWDNWVGNGCNLNASLYCMRIT